MHPGSSHITAVLLAVAGITASATSMACSLAPADPFRIKQMMASEIAHRLGMRPQEVSLNDITQPRLHTPMALGADCSGLATYHHSAGFRIAQTLRPWPGPRPGPWRPDRGAVPGGGNERWPGSEGRPGSGPNHPARCAYEGVAVVLGYGYSSPVAVHFERNCR